MSSVEILGFSMKPWVVLPCLYAAFLFFGWTLKKAVFAWLKNVTSRTETRIDDIVIEAARWPLTLMIFVWSLTVSLHVMGSALPLRWAAYALTASKILTLVSAVLFVDRLLINLFRVGTERFEFLRNSQAFSGVLIHGSVFVVGGLMLLDSMGVSITPIIASLGLGSLAVALALQPTLENVFAGLQLVIDQPIKPGHFIRLESGEEGFVHQIGWRTTWIRQGVDNMIILPNKMIVNARVLNFNYPSPHLSIPVPMGVAYGSDLAKVERVAVEVAKEVLSRVAGGVPNHEPVVRFKQFGTSSIDFVVLLRAENYTDGAMVVHEFIKAVSVRFEREKIVIPYPVMALDTRQQSALFSRG